MSYCELPLGVGQVARLENVVSDIVLLQRQVGGDDVEQAVFGPARDQRGAERGRARVRDGQSEGGELDQRLSTGVGQAE